MPGFAMTARCMQIAGAVLFFAVAPVRGASAGSNQPRVHIRNVVQVEGEVVKLSDLLPPNSPRGLGEVCRQVTLGDAPLAASRRIIFRVEIEQQLRELPSTLQRLEIPDRVVVTRKRRRLSSAEIRAAIEAFMEREGSPALPPSKLNGLDLQAPVFVTQPDPGLEVRRAESDRLERKTRFLLWASKEPRVLPFYVMVGGLPEIEKSTPKPTAPPVVLIAAGEPAKLIIETSSMRLTTLVTPLQSGVEGQLIRVRNADTHQVLLARVVSAGVLQAPLGGE